MLKKNRNKSDLDKMLGEKYEVVARDLTTDGSGVGSIEDITVFVPGLLPEEIGRVQVSEIKKNYLRADLIEILKSSEIRNDPPCPVFGECGGCRLQHMNYEDTLYWKRIWVESALRRIGRIEPKVLPVIGMENPWGYRNKAVLHRDTNGKMGYYREKTSDIIEFPECLLISATMNKRLKVLKELLGLEYKELKSVTLRENSSGKGMVIFEGSIEDSQRFCKRIKEIHKAQGLSPEICSIVASEGKEICKEKGTPYYTETIGGLNFRVSPRAFLQVNTEQTRILYSLVMKLADLTGKETVWDLYCGIGTMTLMLAGKAAKVIGIEENSSAIEDAVYNAKANGISNTKFVEGKVEKKLGDFTKNADLVVVDPPRAGLNRAVVQRLLEVRPQKIIYVSCDPATMARDIGLLVNGDENLKGAYEIGEVQPVDMFPWTGHVETVVLMSRVNK